MHPCKKMYAVAFICNHSSAVGDKMVRSQEAYCPAIPTKTSYRFNIYCFKNYSREMIEEDRHMRSNFGLHKCMHGRTYPYTCTFIWHTHIHTYISIHTHTPHTHICACICSPPHRQEKNTLNINIKERQTPP